MSRFSRINTGKDFIFGRSFIFELKDAVSNHINGQPVARYGMLHGTTANDGSWDPRLSCKDDTGCCLLQLGGYQYKYLKVSESI